VDYSANVTIDTRGDRFYWNAATGEQRQGTLPPVMPPKTDDYIIVDKTRDRLEINGEIAIDGNLTFTGSAQREDWQGCEPRGRRCPPRRAPADL
jgi:hypothetical protein